MKKILSVLMILVLVGGVAFAQDGGPQVSGGATVEWGIDFGSGSQKDFKKGGEDSHAIATHGFYNSSWLGVRFSIIPGGNVASEASADGVYVEFKGSYKADGKNASVTVAKLHFYGAYINVLKPSFKSNRANGWEPINYDPYSAGAGCSKWFTPAFTGWGMTIGFAKPDMMGLDVGLKLGSNGSWFQAASDGKDEERRVKDSKYAFGVDFKMKSIADMLTLDAGLNAVLGNLLDKKNPAEKASDYGYKAGMSPKKLKDTDPEKLGGKDGKKGLINFGLGLTATPMEGMSIGLGFDGVTGLTYEDSDGKLADTIGWDLGLTFKYLWVDAGIYLAGKGTEKDGYDYSDLAKPISNKLDMHFHLGFNAVGETEFVKDLDVHAALNAYNLLSKKNAKSMDADVRKGWIENANLPTATLADKEKLRYTSAISTLPIGFNVGVAYTATIIDSMTIRPYFDLWGETNHIEQHADTTKDSDGVKDTGKLIDKAYLGIAYKLGVEFVPFSKVTVEASWSHGKLNANSYEGGFGGDYMIATPMNHKMHNGTFILGLTLEY